MVRSAKSALYKKKCENDFRYKSSVGILQNTAVLEKKRTDKHLSFELTFLGGQNDQICSLSGVSECIRYLNVNFR